ncbi:MAG: glutamyl-tRNA reductase [Methanothrix sp.]|jgi:glutamyl-tRNA reductase|uniref:Glutamyl-tRNA reductase n=1 Tax=Methanothrix harundinacea TaxID=301375 RepID=A0A124FMI6_9EURY|nr:MAG: Glutamyl-tRNA reductase [Methanothrix harundinacea]MDD2639021.1 glutamyl-tRNA reductase [Methanothrix sp.]MDI9398750.1 glutamyl-tRNA reductase [Euryarchaeota archaeon]KUK97234.1 MAG: Glutamyl-tRNA reductase [Methanothrix harundinacea]MCP1391736.1 glutamyl-tRNA reductase [Methanothrix harundinacea]
MSEIASMLVTHRKASIDDIERAWHGDLETLLKWISSHGMVEECAVLKTCNRVEIYVVSPRGEKVLFEFAKKARISSRIIDFHDHDESLLHLLRLASGLESMIIGEDQILGQMKELYAMAKEVGTTGWTLDVAFKKAISVGKRVRRETRINERSISVGSAAVDLAEEILGSLEGRSVLVIGAGDTGTLISKALLSRNIGELFVTNRTFGRALSLAASLEGTAVPFDRMKEMIGTSDLVISATSAPHYILRRDDLEEVVARRTKGTLLMIDIANPRDLAEDVGEIPGVELRNIDSLREISAENMRLRMAEMERAEAIIAEELAFLKAKYKRRRAEELLGRIYFQAEEIKAQECMRAMNKLGARHTLGEIEERVLMDMSHSIVNKIFAEPTKVLRKAAERGDDDCLRFVEELFGLEVDEDEEDA